MSREPLFIVFAAFPLVALAAVMLGGIIALGVWAYRKDKARRRAVVEFAAQGGHQYVASSPERVGYFSAAPFGTGVNRRVTDVVYGEIDGIAFETFAYTYETESRDAEGNTSRQTHAFQITWIPLLKALPTMRLTPDNPLKRMGKRLGARDLDTESEEFNQVWKVWCEDERVGHAVLTPTMIALLLEPGYRGRRLTLEGRALMTYEGGHTDLRHTPWLVDRLAQVRSRIPSFLFEDHGR